LKKSIEKKRKSRKNLIRKIQSEADRGGFILWSLDAILIQ